MHTFENQIISHMGVLLTTACNLNCKDCADLMSYRPLAYYDPNLAIADIQKILDSVKGIEEVLLIGGEIMLYHELPKVLKFCLENVQIRRVTITTNGVLMPPDTVLELMKSSKAVLRISGYDKHVAPHRDEIISAVNNHGIRLEDMDGMVWCDMGDNHCRNRTNDEIEYIFQNCTMGECICMSNEGKVFFCSRHMTAYETEMYPDPPKYEYVDVRNSTSDMLRKIWPKFYGLKKISTCNYCDGIVVSNVSKVMKPAVQKIKKSTFLTLLSVAESNDETREGKIIEFNECLSVINEELEELTPFKTTNEVLSLMTEVTKQFNAENVDLSAFRKAIRCLVSEVADEFQYDVTCDDKRIEKLIKRRKIYNRHDVVKVAIVESIESGKYLDADIILTEEDIQNDMLMDSPVDEYRYNRLYLESCIDNKEEVKNIIAGLSYVQYGIDINAFSEKTVNLAAGGMDLGYSIKLVRKFLDTHSGVKNILLPFAYYEGFYDMESSTRTFHKIMKDLVILPILDGLEIKESNNSPFRCFIDIDRYRDLYEERIKELLVGKNYFNEYHSQNSFGGLTFDFRGLEGEEKESVAQKTAAGIRKACYWESTNKIRDTLISFMEEMRQKRIRVIIFTPPFTKCLRNHMDPQIEEYFVKEFETLLNDTENCMYINFYSDPDFVDEDFSDFEHLNSMGAKKMSEKLNDVRKKLDILFYSL